MNKLEKLKVSVIMNVHNGEEYIKEAIQSVINQTYENWELIIWDNKSIDKTYFILSQFKDNRIKYFKSKIFLNLYHARNNAIKKAKGKYIFALPGSSGGVTDAWDKILVHQLDINHKPCNFVELFPRLKEK